MRWLRAARVAGRSFSVPAYASFMRITDSLRTLEAIRQRPHAGGLCA